MEHTFILCPLCDAKTRLKLRLDTKLRNFPLFCPKCKRESIIDANNRKIAIVKE